MLCAWVCRPRDFFDPISRDYYYFSLSLVAFGGISINNHTKSPRFAWFRPVDRLPVTVTTTIPHPHPTFSPLQQIHHQQQLSEVPFDFTEI